MIATELLLPLLTVGVAAALAVLATPLFAALAKRIGMVIEPKSERWHKRPTPSLGGAAIAVAVLVPVAAVLGPSSPALVIVGCAGMAFALGLLDDFRHLAPSTKLVGQVLIASTLALGGVRVELIPFPPAAFALTVLWVVAIMNAVNLMDNMDGLAAGISGIAAIVLGVMAISKDPAAAVISAATAGAAFGFLVYNSYPARIFMGDAGSMLLGFMLAAASFLYTATSAASLGLALVGPFAALALPIFDTAFVAAVRRIAGRPIGRGGRDHTSHRIAALGLSDRGAVWLLYGVAAAFGVLGLVAGALTGAVVPLLALGTVTLVLFGLFLAEVDVYGDGEGTRTAFASRQIAIVRGVALRARFAAEVGIDIVLLTIAYYTSYLVRFEGIPTSAWVPQFVQSVPIVIGAQIAALLALRVYRTLWRYLSIADVVNIARAVTLGTASAAAIIFLAFGFEGYSRVVPILDWLVVSALLIGSRSFMLWLRHWFALRPRPGEMRSLIVGANDGGSLALRLLTHSTDTSYRVLGFLDDDPGKRFRQVAGVPILGDTAELEPTIERLGVSLVVLALDKRQHETAARVRASCEQLGIECREFLVPA